MASLAPALPVRRAPLLALLGANTISLVGSQFSVVAIPWFVLLTTGSAVRTGLVAFCELVPAIIASLFGGVLVDRLGYRRASIVADLISGVTVAAIPLLHTTVGLAFWQLLLLVFCGSLFNVPGGTARAALLPDLTTLAGQPIERTTSAVQAIQRGARLIGAPLAGLLIAALGPTTPLWFDAATFLASALLVAVLVPTTAMATAERSERGRFLDELRDGLRFIRRDRLILSIVLTVMVTNLIEAVGWVSMPVFASRLYGNAVALGLMTAAVGGGSMVSALIYGAIGHRLPRRGTFIGAFILLALGYGPLALLPPLPVTLVTLVLLGLAAGPINPLLNAIQYERVPPEMRGRVIGALTAGSYVAMPLGVLAGGLLLDRIGLRPVLILVTTTFFACTLSMLANPAFRAMSEPGSVPADESAEKAWAA